MHFTFGIPAGLTVGQEEIGCAQNLGQSVRFEKVEDGSRIHRGGHAGRTGDEILEGVDRIGKKIESGTAETERDDGTGAAVGPVESGVAGVHVLDLHEADLRAKLDRVADGHEINDKRAERARHAERLRFIEVILQVAIKENLFGDGGVFARPRRNGRVLLGLWRKKLRAGFLAAAAVGIGRGLEARTADRPALRRGGCGRLDIIAGRIGVAAGLDHGRHRELHPHDKPLHVGDVLDVINDDRFLLRVFALLDFLAELGLDLDVFRELLDDAHCIVELFLGRDRAPDDRLVLVESDGQAAITLGRKVVFDLQDVRAAILERGDEVAVDLPLHGDGQRGLAGEDRLDQQHIAVADVGLVEVNDAQLGKARVVDRAGEREPFRFVEIDVETLGSRADRNVVEQRAVAALDREHGAAAGKTDHRKLVGRDIRLFDLDDIVGRDIKAVDHTVDRQQRGLAGVNVQLLRDRHLGATKPAPECEQASHKSQVTE